LLQRWALLVQSPLAVRRQPQLGTATIIATTIITITATIIGITATIITSTIIGTHGIATKKEP